MTISRYSRQLFLAFVLVLGGVANAFANNPTPTNGPAQDQNVRTIPDGQEVKKFRGVVTKREPDSFTMGETTGGQQTVVLLTDATEVKSHKRGVFRGYKDYGASYILRGLRLEVDGVGNSAGQIVASKIRFDEQDLRTAQALQSTVDPLEAEMREKLKQQQAEQERLANQLAETEAVAASARDSA